MRNMASEFGAEDISASSRLSGYLFIFTAYCVLFVSTVKFRQQYYNRDPDSEAFGDGSSGPELSDWKLTCTFYGSLAFMAIIVFIVLVHFDAFMCHQLWQSLLKDGSMGSGVLLTVLFTCALFMLFVSTSATGLGGMSGLNYNVFFSAWAGVFACLHTFDLWVRSLGNGDSIMERLNKSAARTNFYWICTLLFSLITFLSLIDTFIESGGVEQLRERTSLIMLIFSGGSGVCCIVSLILNTLIPSPLNIWCKIEGLTLLALCGFWTYVVFTFTGINGIVNGPSNSYFGVWGTFYFSITTFGVWMKERRRSR